MPLSLITIAPSHYCEKARWALDRAGMKYTEERHLPLFHYLVTLPRARQRTLPILVTPHGNVTESTAIVEFADRALDESKRLFPREHDAEVREWVAEFDRHLGPATRRIAYFHLASAPELFAKTLTAGMGDVPRRLGQAIRRPLLEFMKRGLKLTPEGAARSTKRMEATFAKVDARLADGRRFLVGDRMTAADLTFAALGAPAVLPPEYGSWLPTTTELPGAAELVASSRARAAGEHILRLYREERRRVVA